MIALSPLESWIAVLSIGAIVGGGMWVAIVSTRWMDRADRMPEQWVERNRAKGAR